MLLRVVVSRQINKQTAWGGGPPQVLGRNRTSAGRPAGQTGLWAGVPTLKPPVTPLPRLRAVFCLWGHRAPVGLFPSQNQRFLLVSSSLYWSGPLCRLRRAPPGARAQEALDAAASRGMLLHRGLPGPRPPRPRAAVPPRTVSSSAPGVLASSLLWTLDKARGDLLTQPWGERKKLLRSVFGLSNRACFRIQKGLEGFPPWNVGGRPLP